MNKNKLEIAKTIIHECIHAYLNVKLCEPSIGMSIPNINNMDLTQIINNQYNGFNGSQDQHNFIYNYMLPTMVQILSEVKNTLVSVQDNTAILSTFVLPNYPNSTQNQPFNWSVCLEYLSLHGLELSNTFQNEIAIPVFNSNGQITSATIINNLKWQLYNQYFSICSSTLH